MLKYIVLASALLLCAPFASASSYNLTPTRGEGMRCPDVVAILDAEDKKGLRDLASVIETILLKIDAHRLTDGRSPIFARQSDDGKSNTIGVVAGMCRQHPEFNIREASMYVYNAFAAMGDAIGQ